MKLISLFSRSFATAKSVTVPATLHGIEGRYATALFTASVKENKLDTVEKELAKISKYLQEKPEVEEFLNTPADRKHKMTRVKEILGGKYSKIIENFFDVVAENGRLDQTSKIIAAFNTLMTAQRGQVNVTVTSAQALDGKTLQKLESILGKSSLIGKNSTILLKSKVDPNLMGGLVIEVGEKTIDLSVSSRITKLNSLLATSV
jgi:F-type H+-transporting ATPase subunit O